MFPKRCVLCGSGRSGLCEACIGQLVGPADRPPPPAVDRLVAICAYEGAGRELVLALKRGNRRAAVPLLGAALAEVVGPRRAAEPTAAEPLVTWAPTTAERRRERGFDQAELLARAVARALGLTTHRLLERTGASQMGHDASERRSNPGFGPRNAGRAPSVLNRDCLLVDDVVTTGSTMACAARVLRAAGASSVVGLAIALTPPRTPR